MDVDFGPLLGLTADKTTQNPQDPPAKVEDVAILQDMPALRLQGTSIEEGAIRCIVVQDGESSLDSLERTQCEQESC